MDVDITHIFNNVDPARYSASQAELGPDAGSLTWARAQDRVRFIPPPPLPSSAIPAFRAFLLASGGWSREEILAMTDLDVQALFLQWVCADMREARLDSSSSGADWERYEIDAMDGHVPGNIWRDDDGRVYFYIGG